MRTRLIESALLVFAHRVVEASVIDKVITAAKVSRGTFYNYFRTNEDLLTAVAEAVGNQMLLRNRFWCVPRPARCSWATSERRTPSRPARSLRRATSSEPGCK